MFPEGLNTEVASGTLATSLFQLPRAPHPFNGAPFNGAQRRRDFAPLTIFHAPLTARRKPHLAWLHWSSPVGTQRAFSVPLYTVPNMQPTVRLSLSHVPSGRPAPWFVRILFGAKPVREMFFSDTAPGLTYL